ncbi:hypothetical protein NP233_g43 [Leucocoprinus birnbaumii]|uniref:NACHT domain-containing protein n=1 Tax=Leucocoprinus birnbaumii TaxID=56174 RepID=A0AAD5W4C8_9AGAR|nr:hypothetical protein NP233_g43 [Leucocoprinus birnbaumii]
MDQLRKVPRPVGSESPGPTRADALPFNSGDASGDESQAYSKSAAGIRNGGFFYAVRLLATKAVAQASLDSSARHPPPRCHPQTRTKIRKDISHWLCNSARASNFLWLYGPAGAGKTAIAQTIGELCLKEGWLGAAFFFSRLSQRDDPERVVPSLAYQFAVTYERYRGILDHLLANDPLILEKAFPVQFEQLLAQPLIKVFGDSSSSVVIIVDGLDECRGDPAQRELISLIFNFATTCHRNHIPVLWIISSRPEWQIVSTLVKLDPSSTCQRIRLSIGDEESQKDLCKYLRTGFDEIRERLSQVLGDVAVHWPKEEQMLVLEDKASGLFIFGDTLLKFIGDEDISNPVAQLDLCLAFLQGNRVPITANPLDPLASLYRGIMQTVHSRALHTTLQILYSKDRALGWLSAWRGKPNTPNNKFMLDYLSRSSDSQSYKWVLSLSNMTLQHIYFQLSATEMHHAVEELGAVDLGDLFLFHCAHPHFKTFLLNLETWQRDSKTSNTPFLRTTPQNPIDHQLSNMYSDLLDWPGMKKLDLGIMTTTPFSAWEFHFMNLDDIGPDSKHPPRSDARRYNCIARSLWFSTPMYFFLGRGENACLVIATQMGLTTEGHLTRAFQEIREYFDIRQPWPSRSHLQLIASTTIRKRSQLTLGVYSLMAYISDRREGNPVHRLDEIICMISSNRTTGLGSYSKSIMSSHYVPFDQFLNQLLLHVPPLQLVTARRIILFLECLRPFHYYFGRLQGPFTFSIQTVASFLDLEEVDVNRALRYLHPIVFRCPEIGNWSIRDRLMFLIPGMEAQSYEYGQPKTFPRLVTDSETWINGVEKYVTWVNTVIVGFESSRLSTSNGNYQIYFSDSASSYRAFLVAAQVTGGELDHEWTLTCLLDSCWVAFGNCPDSVSSTVIKQLRDLQLCHLHLQPTLLTVRRLDADRSAFLWCVNQLHAQNAGNTDKVLRIVRTACQSLVDRRLFSKLKHFSLMYTEAAFPLKLQRVFSDSDDKPLTRFHTVTLHHPSSLEMEENADDYKWEVFLLGFGVNTCMVVVRAETGVAEFPTGGLTV